MDKETVEAGNSLIMQIDLLEKKISEVKHGTFFLDSTNLNSFAPKMTKRFKSMLTAELIRVKGNFEDKLRRLG